MAKRRTGPVLPDQHLWTAVKRTVEPLPGTLAREARGEPASLPMPARADALVPRIDTHSLNVPPAPRPAAKKRGLAEPMEPRLRRRLGRGQIEIDGTIDLHGMRQIEAETALRRFLAARSARGDRTVLVITGKGLKKLGPDAAVIVEAGVLRGLLPMWLSAADIAPLVAGWSAAAQQHGGEGAFYVRLKRVQR